MIWRASHMSALAYLGSVSFEKIVSSCAITWLMGHVSERPYRGSIVHDSAGASTSTEIGMKFVPGFNEF
jgi:hypothetical protein